MGLVAAETDPDPLEDDVPARPAAVFEAAPQPRRRRRRALVIGALAVACVVVLVIEGVAIVGNLDPGDERSAPRTGRTAPLVAPADLPARGELVQSVVRADGTVAVTQWVRTSDPIQDVAVAAPSGLSATGARLVASDGTVLADDLTIADDPRQLPLADETSLVRATYVLRGAADESGTVPGRVVAKAVSLDLSSAAEAGPTVVIVEAADGGVVRNLACANARSSVALLRPCGTPDGPRWRVRLAPGSRGDVVAAQVDVP